MNDNSEDPSHTLSYFIFEPIHSETIKELYRQFPLTFRSVVDEFRRGNTLTTSIHLPDSDGKLTFHPDGTKIRVSLNRKHANIMKRFNEALGQLFVETDDDTVTKINSRKSLVQRALNPTILHELRANLMDDWM